MAFLMMKKYFLCLFFIVNVVNVINVGEAFAFPEEGCPNVLLTTLDKDHQRFRELSPDAKNMLQIASIIAQVTHRDTLTAKVNIYHILLAALTKIPSANESIYRLNLIDINGDGENKSALFVVLKNLGILRDFQSFLLEEIGLNRSDPEPFAFQSDGSLLLNLNEAVLTSTIIDYDEKVDHLWHLAIREKEEEIRYINRQRTIQMREEEEIRNIHRQRTIQMREEEDAIRYINIRDKTKRYDKSFWISTFPEHFFLASLNIDLPIFYFLSEYFDGKTPAQIKDTLYKLIDQARRSFWNFSKKKKRNSYSKEEKAQSIALVIKRKKETGGSFRQAIAEVAKQIKIPASSLRDWIFKYKAEVIDLVINREQEIGTEKAIAEVAKEKNIDLEILQDWVEYKKNKPKPSKRNFYSKKRKAEALDLMIEKINKKIGIEKAFAEVAEQTKIHIDTLKLRFGEYKRVAIHLVIEKKKEMEIEKAIAKVAKQTGFSVDNLTHWFYHKYKKEVIDLIIKKKKEMGGSFRQAIAELAKQTKIPAPTVERWFYKYKAEVIDLVIKIEKEIGRLKAIVKVAEKTGFSVDDLTRFVSLKVARGQFILSEKDHFEGKRPLSLF